MISLACSTRSTRSYSPRHCNTSTETTRDWFTTTTTSLSHHKNLENLGEGGMGEVYMADDLELARSD